MVEKVKKNVYLLSKEGSYHILIINLKTSAMEGVIW